MRGIFPNYRGTSLCLALGLVLASLVLIVPCNLHAASNEQMITFSGQKITSIFDGLGPSRFAPDFAPKRDKSRKTSWLLLLEEKSLDGHLGAHYLKACTCQDSACFGSFEIVVPCYGCCTDPTGCGQINNYQTNTSKGTQGDQVEDEPCGPDCCDDFFGC